MSAQEPAMFEDSCESALGPEGVLGHDLEVAKRAALDRVTLMETWGPAQLIPPDQVQAIIGGPVADLPGSAKIRGKRNATGWLALQNAVQNGGTCEAKRSCGLQVPSYLSIRSGVQEGV